MSLFEPVGFEQPMCGIGLIRLEWTKVEIGRRSGILRVALSIEHDELHPARHYTRLPMSPRSPIADSVVQRHEYTGFEAVLVGLVDQDGAALQDIACLLQRDGDRYVEQSVARRDDGRLRLVAVTVLLVETNTLITLSDRYNAAGETIPIAETPRHARNLIASGLPPPDLTAKPRKCLLEEGADVVAAASAGLQRAPSFP